MQSLWLDSRTGTDQTRSPLQAQVEVTVVGAGLTGLCTALLLARAGRQVQVLEAGSVGSLTTGASTGKVSLLQGTKLSRMRRVQSEAVVRSYLESNRVGQAWLLEFCDDHDIAVETRDAVTYASNAQDLPAVIDEHAAAGSLGLPVRWTDELDVPFPVCGATVLPDQTQIDPVRVLDALADQVRAHGGTIVEGARVQSVSRLGVPTISLATGERVRTETLVLATGSPILDRGLYFAKLEAHRSYLIALRTAAPPTAMYLAAGEPTYSLRDVVGNPEANLLVGGGGHVVGRATSEIQGLERLRAWALEQFPDAVEAQAWSAQDYSSHDGIPYVGRLPRGFGHIYLATGYDKWGLTNAPAAALRIAAQILGDETSWDTRPLSRRITRPTAAWSLVTRNARVAAVGVAGLIGAQTRGLDRSPAPGAGSVGRRGLSPWPQAVSSPAGEGSLAGEDCPGGDGAEPCQVSGICTHLGGVLHWNDAEETWDCPLHGSRFAPDGQVLEGPATRALARTGDRSARTS